MSEINIGMFTGVALAAIGVFSWAFYRLAKPVVDDVVKDMIDDVERKSR